MRISSILLLAFAAEGALASTWFSKAIYNKWHETELERWLSDHNVPYPTPADRKDLENLVKENWNSKVVQPYNDWDIPTMQAYLSEKGADAKYQTEKNKDTLLSQVQKYWYETGDKAGETYGDVKGWIFNTWDDSSLKSFAEYHGIVPKPPSKREQLLSAVQENYESAAAKATESAAYPGDWIYAQYTDSALKKWLDERGYPVPQPSTRDKLISSVRRNSYLASLKYNSIQSSLSSSAEAAQQTLTDKLIDGWSDTQLKAFLDKNGIKVPQGSKKNELVAILRKHRAQLTGDTVSASVVSAYGAATSKAGNEYAKATDGAAQMYNDAFDSAIDTWSASRLKAYLDSRGVPVGPDTTLDNLRATVRLHKHKALPATTLGLSILGLLRISRSGSVDKAKLRARRHRDPAMSSSLQPSLCIRLPLPAVEVPMPPPPRLLPCRPMPPRTPLSIPGPSPISRNTLTSMASQPTRARTSTSSVPLPAVNILTSSTAHRPLAEHSSPRSRTVLTACMTISSLVSWLVLVVPRPVQTPSLAQLPKPARAPRRSCRRFKKSDFGCRCSNIKHSVHKKFVV